jgi:hypothetical protein
MNLVLILVKKFLVSLHPQLKSGKREGKLWKKQKYYLLHRKLHRT